MKKKAVEIPEVIYTDQFLKFVEHYTKEFKKYNGYGKHWLKEWARMEERGMFKPEKLRELYIKILDGSNTLSYIYWDAVHYICIQALDAAKTFALTNSFEIRVITGEIAFNDDDEELKDLSMEEALAICKAMNDEAEELLFRVYNSNTNKLVK
jgi:hypothetical protein